MKIEEFEILSKRLNEALPLHDRICVLTKAIEEKKAISVRLQPATFHIESDDADYADAVSLVEREIARLTAEMGRI